MSKTGFQVRQGDVLIVSVDRIPDTATEQVTREDGRIVLAHGELTGHAHAIKDQRATLLRDPMLNAVFMRVTGNDPVALEHDEHDPISIPPGSYQVVRQREYQPGRIRTVAD